VTGGRGCSPYVATVMLLLVVLGGGALVRRHSSNKRPDTLVVGDSVTYLSAGPIQTQLGPSQVQLIGLPGYRSLDIYPYVQKALDQHSGPSASRQRAIFLVGYNDVMRRSVDSVALAPMLKQANSFECSVWLSLPVRPGGARSAEPRYDPDRATAWNARVADLAPAYPHVHVSDRWANAVDAPGEMLLQVDGVHPNAAGQQQLAQEMSAALDTAC